MTGHVNISENMTVDFFMVVLSLDSGIFLYLFMQLYVLDMFFNALNCKLEPQSICVTMENPNLSLSVQGPRTD